VLRTVTCNPLQPERYAICHIGSRIGWGYQVVIAGDQLQRLVRACDCDMDGVRIRRENTSVGQRLNHQGGNHDARQVRSAPAVRGPQAPHGEPGAAGVGQANSTRAEVGRLGITPITHPDRSVRGVKGTVRQAQICPGSIDVEGAIDVSA
jgi:hypothetical protein